MEVFIAVNFFSLTYLVLVWPYENDRLNYMNIFNGVISLVVSYLILPLQDIRYDPDQLYELGSY